MKQKLIATFFLVIIVIGFVGWVQQVQQIKLIPVHAVDGHLNVTLNDVRQLNNLLGDWQYYPGLLANEIPTGQTENPQTVVVEHKWDKDPATGYAYGFATYRLIVTGLQPGSMYGVYIQDEFSAYSLMINGNLILQNGQVGKVQSDYTPRVYSDTGYFIADQSGQTIITIEIANFSRSNGGFWNAPLIGQAKTIEKHFNNLLSIEVMILAFVLALGVLFVLLSLWQRENRSILMAAFLLMIALRMVSTGIHLIQIVFPNMPLMAIIRIEYLSGYLFIPLAGMLLEEFKIKRSKPILFNIYLGAIPATILFVLLVPNAVLTESFVYVQIVIIGLTAYTLYILVNGLRHNYKDFVYATIGFSSLIIGGLIEISPLKNRYGLFFTSILFVLFISVFVVIQIANVKSKHDLLESEILRDPLTGLGNRVAMFRQLDHWQKSRDQAQRSILFLDLNRFKSINDTFGHALGDEVLRLSANRLQNCIRSTDHVYRIGGDEFVILAQTNALDQDKLLVERIKESFTHSFILNDRELSVGISVGIEHFVPGQESSDAILSRSDARMYEDKRKNS
ncbi:MAG: GGDEF domain-containing protein [Eubacteriales bacterium]|nr:GGDEF domain-containing protein [Eubacteriales bacterium]